MNMIPDWTELTLPEAQSIVDTKWDTLGWSHEDKIAFFSRLVRLAGHHSPRFERIVNGEQTYLFTSRFWYFRYNTANNPVNGIHISHGSFTENFRKSKLTEKTKVLSVVAVPVPKKERTMNFSDLKAGQHIVHTRNGSEYLFIGGQFIGASNIWTSSAHYKEDLCSKTSKDFDIVKVYARRGHGAIIDLLENVDSTNLVWECPSYKVEQKKTKMVSSHEELANYYAERDESEQCVVITSPTTCVICDNRKQAKQVLDYC